MKVNNINFSYSNMKNSNAIKNSQTYPNLQPLNADIISFKANPKALRKKLSIISGRSNSELSEAIAEKLGLKIGERSINNFADGEIYVKIKSDIQGKDVYLVQPSATPVNDSIMELLLMTDAAKRADAKKVIAVMPYMGYERQDRKMVAGESIAAKLHAKLLEAAGIDKVIAIDLHASQIEGFFENESNVVHLSAIPVLSKYIKKKNIEDLVIVSPDVGGGKRVKALAKELNCPCAIIDKEREQHNEAKAINLYGEVAGKNCVLYDDMIDTAGTIIEAVKMIKDKGAKDIYVCATHGIFSEPAFDRLNNAPIKEIIITNTLPLKKNAPDKITQIDISSLVADAIKKLSAD